MIKNDVDADVAESSHPAVNDRKVTDTELCEDQHSGSSSNNLFSSPSLFSPTVNRTAQSIFASNPVENPILTPPIMRIGRKGMDNLNDEVEAMGEYSYPPDEITNNNQGITLDLDSLEEVPLESDIIKNAASPSAVVQSPSGETYIPLSKCDASVIMKSDNRETNSAPHDCADPVTTMAPSLSVAPAEHSHHYNISRFPAASSPTNSTHSGISEQSSFAGHFSYKHGDIVWAQTETFLPFWPGFIFIEHDKLPEHMQLMLAGVGHRRSPSAGSSNKRKKLCVYFYGKDDFDLVLESRIKDFNSHSDLRYSQSHTLGPGGAIVTFLKACHLAQEELLKEPWQRVEWLIGDAKSSTSNPSTFSVTAASTTIVDTPAVVNDKLVPVGDDQQEGARVIADASVELKLPDVASDSHSTLGNDCMIAAEKDAAMKDSSPNSLSEGTLAGEIEQTMASITISPEAAADVMLEEKITHPTACSELQNPIQLGEDGEELLVDSAEPFPRSSTTSTDSIDAANLAEIFVNELADNEASTQQEDVSEHTVVDGAVAGEELSGYETESLPNLAIELPLSASVENTNSTAIAETDEEKYTVNTSDSFNNMSVEEVNTVVAAPAMPESFNDTSVERTCTLEALPTVPESLSSPNRKLAEKNGEAPYNHSSSLGSTFLASPPKGNGSDVPSKLSPVKKYAPSLSLSDASTLFGGAGESGDSSIFQKPVFPTAPVVKSLFPSSTTAGNPFDSAPSVTPLQKPIHTVNNSRAKPVYAANDASALFGSQPAAFPPPTFPTNAIASSTASTSNISAMKSASVKTARVVASDASSLFSSGTTGFPESSTIPVKTVSQKSLAAADLFGPPPPSSEPPLFASQMTTKSLFVATQKVQSEVNPTRNRDPIHSTERQPAVLTTEKTSAVSRNNDRLFPPSQIAPKSSDDFFSSRSSSSHSGNNAVAANFGASTESDSNALFKAPTSSLTLSLPFPTNASTSDFAPPQASPAIAASMTSSPSYLSNKPSPDQSAKFFQNTPPTDSSAPSLLTVSRSSVSETSSKSGDASDTTPSETSSDLKILPPSGPIIPTVKSAIESFSQPPMVGSSLSAPNPPLIKKKSSGVLFHGKAQVISGASPFDFDPSGGPANPFSSIPAPQQPSPSLFPPTASSSQNDLFSTAKSASTPPISSSIVANSPFKTGVINNSSSSNKSVSAEGLFSAPAPGSASKIKLKQVPASEVFNFAPPATPTSTTSTGSDGATRDPFSPPMAPGVKPQIQKDRDDKADPSDVAKPNAPAPFSVSGKKGGKGPVNTSSGCPPGMMPTPHGFVSIPTVAKATIEVPKEATFAAEELFASTVISPPSVNPIAPVSNVMPIGPPKAPGVQISRPSAPLAERQSNFAMGIQSNEYRAGPGLQDRRFNHGRPFSAVVVAFGFGGKLITMFPKYRPPLNPLSSYGGDIAMGESRCYVPSALRVYRTIDLVKASADPSNYPLEQRNICPYPEMQLFYKLLSASETFRPDAASTEAIRGFIEERRLGHVTPLYLSISDRYFAENDQVRLTEKRTALQRSEQLLWGLLAIMLGNGGKLSSADISTSEISNDSPEKAIAALLLQDESSLETLPAPLTAGSQDPDLLRKVERLLLEGKRQDAFNLALGQGAWALALVIGSVCGAEQYQLAVRSFASTLMSSSTSATAPLYMAAMLFSNQVTQQLATVDKNALSSWRSTLCTLLCNKGSDWKDLVTLLGMKLLQEKEDVCAAHFAFLCSEIFPSVPISTNTAGQYLLLGGDLGQGSHRSMDNVIALSALRRTETLEFILANPIHRLNPPNADANGNASIKSSGGFSSLFNWGGGGSKASSDIGAGSSGANTNTSSKQQLDKIRSALAPLKLRLAILLADFGLTKEAAEYAKRIRAIVKEAETVDAAAVDAKHASSKNKNPPPTSSSSSTAKPFNKHFVRALDEFCDRLGIVVGVDETSLSSMKDKEKKASSLWSVSSVFNAISAANLKEFVDGPSSQPNLAQPISSPPESNQANVPSNRLQGPDQIFSSSKGNNANSNSQMGSHGSSSAYPSYSQPPGFPLNPNQGPLPFPSNPNPNPNPNPQPKNSDFRAADGQTWFVGENPLPGQGTTPPPTIYHGGTYQGDANRSPPPTQSQSAAVQPLPKTSSTQDATANEMKAPPIKAAAPASAAHAPAPAPAPAASGAATGTVDANNKGLVKTLHKGLLKWLYPNAHDASGNLGDQNVAYFDKATGKWVFPGEESNNVPDPATLAPPTGPIGQQSYLGNPGDNSNPNLSSLSSSQPSQESFDPLAALIAPPSYRIPAATNSSQHVSQLGSFSSSSSSNLDPLAALMAPPSANRYSAVSYHNPSNRSMGQLAPDTAGFPSNEGPPSSSSSAATSSGPPPKISMWVPTSSANSSFNSSSSNALNSFGWDSSEGQRQGQGAESDGMTTIDLNGTKSES